MGPRMAGEEPSIRELQIQADNVSGHPGHQEMDEWFCTPKKRRGCVEDLCSTSDRGEEGKG